MTGTHVTVTLCDGSSITHISVLPVHVVGSTTGIITQPDAVVLDGQWSLLEPLLTKNDFTNCLLDLLKFLDEIPVARLGRHMIICKDFHLVQWRVLELVGWVLAPHHIVLLQLSLDLHDQ